MIEIKKKKHEMYGEKTTLTRLNVEGSESVWEGREGKKKRGRKGKKKREKRRIESCENKSHNGG